VWRADEYFFAEQNARLVRNAEAYYRSMFGGSTLAAGTRAENVPRDATV
jgi:erythromycin esterase-like protein